MSNLNRSQGPFISRLPLQAIALTNSEVQRLPKTAKNVANTRSITEYSKLFQTPPCFTISISSQLKVHLTIIVLRYKHFFNMKNLHYKILQCQVLSNYCVRLCHVKLWYTVFLTCTLLNKCLQCRLESSICCIGQTII